MGTGASPSRRIGKRLRLSSRGTGSFRLGRGSHGGSGDAAESNTSGPNERYEDGDPGGGPATAGGSPLHRSALYVLRLDPDNWWVGGEYDDNGKYTGPL